MGQLRRRGRGVRNRAAAQLRRLCHGPRDLRDFLCKLGSHQWRPVHRPDQRHAETRGISITDGDEMERHPPRPRPSPRDRPVEGKAWEGPHQVRDEPPRRHACAKPPHRRVPLLDQARRSRGRATTVPRRGHLGARPETVRPDNAGERFSDPHLSASLKAAKMLTWALFLPVDMLVRAISLKGWRPLAWRRPRRSGRDFNPYSGQPTRHKWVENAAIVAIPHGGSHTTGA